MREVVLRYNSIGMQNYLALYRNVLQMQSYLNRG
jgi:hypothetical protein